VELRELEALRSRLLETANDTIQERRAPGDAARELYEIYVSLVKLEVLLQPFISLAPPWEYYDEIEQKVLEEDREEIEQIEQKIVVAAETLRRKLSS